MVSRVSVESHPHRSTRTRELQRSFVPCGSISSPLTRRSLGLVPSYKLTFFLFKFSKGVELELEIFYGLNFLITTDLTLIPCKQGLSIRVIFYHSVS